MKNGSPRSRTPGRWYRPPTPDLGGQHLISLYAMRHEVAEGAARVHDLIAQIAGGTKFRLRAI